MKLLKRIAFALAPLSLLSLGLFPTASFGATIERSVTCSPNSGGGSVTMNVGDTLVISTTNCRGAGTGGAVAGSWAFGPNGTETTGAFPGNYSFEYGGKVSFVATQKNTTGATGITLWSGYGTTGTMGPQILITVSDTTPPTLSSSTPSDNAASVAVSSNIVLSFSESVKAGTGNILIKKSSDNTTFATIPIANAQITISASTVTINPTADLDTSTGYYVEIASGVILDLSDNAFTGITSPTTLNFTTAPAATTPTAPAATTPTAPAATTPTAPAATLASTGTNPTFLIGMSGFTILLGALFLTQSHRLIRSIR
jgi:methionine-rich copper-binding protein CopC